MLDISNDWPIFDKKETISIQNIGQSVVTIQNAVRRPSTIAIADASGTVVFGAAITFIVFKANVSGGFVPKINARITDYLGKNYRIDSVDDGALRSRWLIQCTSEAGQGIN